MSVLLTLQIHGKVHQMPLKTLKQERKEREAKRKEEEAEKKRLELENARWAAVSRRTQMDTMNQFSDTSTATPSTATIVSMNTMLRTKSGVGSPSSMGSESAKSKREATQAWQQRREFSFTWKRD